MADAKRVTILNQREGKIILPPDPEELKKNPKAPARVLMSGQAIEVSAEEAPRFLRYNGLIDASKLVANVETAEVKALKAKLAASEAENARLKKGSDDADSEDDDVDNGVLDAKKGVACLLPDGSQGVVQSVNKAKKTAKVKRDDNGEVSDVNVADLKPVPAAAA